MKTIVKSPGSATVINAISTGCGSAFGIKLYVTAETEMKSSNSSEIICTADAGIDTTLMEICARNVVCRFKEHYNIDEIDKGISIKTSSTLPVASGLSSSSATSNAVVTATAYALMNEYNVKPDDLTFNKTRSAEYRGRFIFRSRCHNHWCF